MCLQVDPFELRRHRGGCMSVGSWWSCSWVGGLEEFGWRGFAQPRLQERYTALTAAVEIGIAWGIWHLPLFYFFDVAAYDISGFWTGYMFTLVVQSVIYAWLFNSIRGALLFPMIAHSLSNLSVLTAHHPSLTVP
jgi:membrane protease YdiL (CAAX protease family)